MKKILVFTALAFLVACKEKGDTRTPKGIIITAVQALSDGDAAKFTNVLSEGALQKYGSTSQQNELKNQLGNIRQLEISDERVLSHSTLGNSTVTVSQVDVKKSGQIIYNVITRCKETRMSYTHQVCHTYDPNPPRHDDYDRPSHGGGGGYGGGGNNNGGGYGGGQNHDPVTPGPSHDSGGGNDSGGGKPGRDPGGPGRYPIIEAAYGGYGMTTECHDETNTDISVGCTIIDLR